MLAIQIAEYNPSSECSQGKNLLGKRGVSARDVCMMVGHSHRVAGAEFLLLLVLGVATQSHLEV